MRFSISPMYKRLIFLLTLLLSFQVLSAQGNYQRYLTLNTSWYEYSSLAIFSGYQPCYLGGETERFSYYHVVGTDIFQGTAWYRVHLDWKEVINCLGGPTLTNTYALGGPAFHIREDSAGKIYVRNYTWGTEKEVYNFGPAYGVGDTLRFDNGNYTCVVGQVDSVYLGSDARARYWCDCTNPPFGIVPSYIIEGIGTSRKLMHPRDACDEMVDGVESVICYRQNGQQITIDSMHSCGVPGHVVVGLEPPNAAGFSWRFLDEGRQLQVEWPDGPTDFTFSLYDLTGAQLAQGRGAHRVDVSGFSTGWYLLRVRAGDAAFARKVFKP